MEFYELCNTVQLDWIRLSYIIVQIGDMWLLHEQTKNVSLLLRENYSYYYVILNNFVP